VVLGLGLTVFDSGMLVSGGLTVHSGALKVSVKIRVRVRVRGLTIYSGALKVSMKNRVRAGVRVRVGVKVHRQAMSMVRLL
jgi:hypothetical protein